MNDAMIVDSGVANDALSYLIVLPFSEFFSGETKLNSPLEFSDIRIMP